MNLWIMRSYINEGEIHWGMAEIKAASGDRSDPTEVSYTMVMRSQGKKHYLERQRTPLMHYRILGTQWLYGFSDIFHQGGKAFGNQL